MNKREEEEARRMARVRRTPVSLQEPKVERMGRPYPRGRGERPMRIERGDYQVVLYCCTSGNCTTCLAGWVKDRRKRLVHMDNLSRATAEAVARNWAAYDPMVEHMRGRGERLRSD